MLLNVAYKLPAERFPALKNAARKCAEDWQSCEGMLLESCRSVCAHWLSWPCKEIHIKSSGLAILWDLRSAPMIWLLPLRPLLHRTHEETH